MNRDAKQLVLTLLEHRARDATLCPSEVARALAADAGEPAIWRKHMPTVHDAIDQLQSEGRVRLSWKGRILPRRHGPYRIRRA
ncbi:MAG: DUF3253 domain-containing protein [Brevundimonas sp.]|nr:DUF3253 domain-containing protein [Brevundimonas sp.]